MTEITKKPDWKRTLADLEDAANEILHVYKAERLAEKPFRRGGVNWADLSAQVFYTQDGDENAWFEVIIEEVSPDETELREVVRDRLQAKGFSNFEITTEW